MCAAPAYLARRGRPERPEALLGHDCLGYTYQESWDFIGPAGPFSLRVRGRHRINNNAMLRELVLKGHGIAQLPAYVVARDIAAGTIATLLDAYKDTSRSVYVVYPHRRHLPRKVRAFVEFLAEEFALGAPWSVAPP